MPRLYGAPCRERGYNYENKLISIASGDCIGNHGIQFSIIAWKHTR